MSNFQLKQEGLDSSTGIPNNFIENYMPTAAGEFVKIYIYLLKCVNENRNELSISRLADVFNNTEKDTIRAMKYWEKKGLLKLSFNEDGSLKSLILTSVTPQETMITKTPAEELIEEKTLEEKTPAAEELYADTPKRTAFPVQKQYSRNELDSFSGNEDNSLLIYGIQKLLGRTLNSADINTIMFFLDTLHFPEDLVEYVFEYCVSKKKTGIRYIEKTGIAWAQQGIKDVAGAKLLNAIYSENCYPVMKAFGLTGRNPAKEEIRHINTWIISYGFSLDMIIEACNRTINTIHKPSFEYADSILRKWKNSGIHTLEAVKKADEAFSSKSASRHKSPEKDRTGALATGNNGFNGFHQRTYNYDELEAKLIGR
ncbi:MAG: DnaD domain protein [Lachnospiraceae bacterium]|jgi:DnaD/phage-associated family protein